MMKGKTVLLFSGGMDSFAAAWLLKPDTLLYMDTGLPEQDAELSHIQSLSLPPGSRLVVDDRVRLADQKLANEIVPMRNLFFAMAGAYYGSTVYLAALAGDTTRDKDMVFARTAEGLLRYVLGDPGKAPATVPDGDFRLELPFKHLTKTELVRLYIVSGSDPSLLLDTRSCYGSGDRECGRCRSCVRKFVALSNNCVPGATEHFAESPVPRLEEALHYAHLRNRGRETEDITAAIERAAARG
jgi:7-cyano-7-deazaguanine synthase in queuosine biosynthesis